MAKIKYKFNHNSISYEKIVLSGKQKFYRFLTYLSATLIIAIIYNVAFTLFFDTPKEKGLIRENKQLADQYINLNNKFDLVENTLEDLKKRDDNIYRVIFEAEPIPASVRSAGFGGTNRYVDLQGFKSSELVVEIAQRLDKITKELYVQSKSYDEVIEMAENKEEMVAAVPAIMPISNKDLRRTASGWGWRIHPIYKIRKFHYGMDFTAQTGTEIYVTGDGVVEVVDNSLRGYGKRIVVNHGFGYKTLYAHLNGFNVRKGQKVKRGEVIGFVGSSGTSTAPHLHYEVFKNNNKVNPVHYYFNDLTAEEFDKMIFISSNSGQSFD
ncbi:MAG: M23 family metallopeptidase [Bacteroidales bacterium]|jgi:murein DD-endopeptidase MepM/ murein hydrolase activator NlpD|nr:M23 family metallopeptidase [Bacteroidales bacterium]